MRNNFLSPIKFFLSGALLFGFSVPVLYPQENKEDPRKEILLYGIEDDVLTLVSDLAQEKIDTYNSLLAEIMEETRDSDIIGGIYEVWTSTSYTEGLPIARKEIEKVSEDEDFNRSDVQSAISFVSSLKDAESLPLLLRLIGNNDTPLETSAIEALGNIGIPEDEETYNKISNLLVERLEEVDLDSEDNLAVALIVTLGEYRYKGAADDLVLILEDTGASIAHRRLTCVSLGKIGRDEDYGIIERIYNESEDALLRAYALAGLAEYKNSEITPILIRALKRDSYWRIRVTAAEKLAGNKEKGVSKLLKFKAVKDTIPQVRAAALQSLAASSFQKDKRFVADYYKNPEMNSSSRLTALSAAVQNKNLGIIDSVKEVMGELWAEDKERFLEFTCRDLSRSEWPALSPLYAKMLTHSSWLIQIYGIRGIRRNNLNSLQPRVQEMNREGTDSRVRQEIDSGNSSN